MTAPDDVRRFVAEHRDQVRRLGGTFMKSPDARAAAAALGLGRLTYYFRGRSGVLGAVPPDPLAAVLAVFPAAVVRRYWPLDAPPRAGEPEPRRDGVPGRGLDPSGFAADYAAACRAWGRRCLAGFPEPGRLHRLADLLAAVADTADATGAPLFAGWRAVPRPEHPAERVVLAAHVLREHRGSMHLTALRATGLSPLAATLTRDGGDRRARQLGWREPFPVVTEEVRRRRRHAERLTDELAAPAWAVLGAAERAEAGALLRAAYDVALPVHRATHAA